MSRPKQEPSRSALASLGLLYAVDILLICINHDRHASTLTTASVGVVLMALLLVRVHMQDRRCR